MMKTIDHPRFLQHLLGLACITSLTVSCTGYVGDPSTGEPSPDAPAMDVDPTGNWSLTYMLDDGCGQPASVATTTFTVTLASNGYAVSAAGVTTTGTLVCTPDHCKLSGMMAWSTTDGQFQQNVNMVLDSRGGVTGSGTMSVIAGTTTCGVTFTVSGSKN